MNLINIDRAEFRKIATNPYKHYAIDNDDEVSVGILSTHEVDVEMPVETILGHLQRTVTAEGNLRYVKRTPVKGDGTILGEVI